MDFWSFLLPTCVKHRERFYFFHKVLFGLVKVIRNNFNLAVLHVLTLFKGRWQQVITLVLKQHNRSIKNTAFSSFLCQPLDNTIFTVRTMFKENKLFKMHSILSCWSLLSVHSNIVHISALRNNAYFYLLTHTNEWNLHNICQSICLFIFHERTFIKFSWLSTVNTQEFI